MLRQRLAPYSYQGVTLSVSPQIASVPVNTSVSFTSTTANVPNTPPWTLFYTFANANPGSPTDSSGPTYVYTAPPTPPIYTSPGYVSGTVTLQA